MNKHNGSGSMGMSLLAVIFFVLALSLFAALTLSTAKKDSVLSAEMAEKKTAYYTALNKAEELLLNTDEAAKAAYSEAQDEEEYYALLEIAFAGSENCEYDQKGRTLSYNIIIKGSQSLYILLDMAYPSAGEYFYTVRAYKSISDSQWEADTPLNLISFDN